MGRTKVFVGNLSFKTTDADLAAEFSSAGKVVNANIITRGPRSLGYGFVELESEDDAQKAVSLMNKKAIDGREINVELAKPREETRGDDRRPNRRRPRGPPRGRGGYSMRRNFSSRGRGYRGRGRGGMRGGRPSLANRTPSTTTLFVANLPFSVDDNGLKDVFKEYNVVSAHVVQNKSGRSKGFGFVEFANEADQQKALKGCENKEVEGRELIVKVALTGDKKVEDQDKKEIPQKNEEKTDEKKDSQKS